MLSTALTRHHDGTTQILPASRDCIETEGQLLMLLGEQDALPTVKHVTDGVTAIG